ncbi:hypothetical protein DFH27DRAFT_308330 [Peziza echinospora]|nr:hypothetical protein DFH27DRAFT_308330 [Peziza echinospora]
MPKANRKSCKKSRRAPYRRVAGRRASVISSDHLVGHGFRGTTSSAIARVLQEPQIAMPKISIDNGGLIDSFKENCNNTKITDNSIDNHVDQSVHESTSYVDINHGTNITYNYVDPQLPRQRNELHKAHFMVPFSRNRGYIGKSQTFEFLDERIQENDFSHYRMAIWGMGGAGKTQDVLECVYHYQPREKDSRAREVETENDKRVSVFWIYAGKPERFEQDYRKLAELAGLPGHGNPNQDIRPIVKSWLERPESGNWILVLDNADNKLDFFNTSSGPGLADFVPHGSKGIVILTTRDKDVARKLLDNPSNILDKRLMDSNHARQLFTQGYPEAIQHTCHKEQDNAIFLLLEALQFLPLAITQAAAYLSENLLLSPSDYLQLFNSTKDRQKELLSKQFSDIRREVQNETTLATISISFHQLQEQSPLAISLLHIISLIDNRRIPYELLEKGGLVNEGDQFKLKEAISRLINFCLLSTTQHGQSDFYEMHLLVHVSIRSFSTTEDMDEALKCIVRAVGNISNGWGTVHMSVWGVYVSHLSSIKRYLNANININRRLEIDMNARYDLLGFVIFYIKMGFSKEVIELAVQILRVSTEIHGSDEEHTIEWLNLRKHMYYSLGDFESSLNMALQALEASKRLLHIQPSKTTHLWKAMAQLAELYVKQNIELKEAEKMLLHVSEEYEREFGTDHEAWYTRAKLNLARIYTRQGNVEMAENLLVQVAEKFRVYLECINLNWDGRVKVAMWELAEAYHENGQFEKAEKIRVLIVKSSQETFGPEHSTTLNSMTKLAITYREQKRSEEAEKLQLQVYETRVKILGLEHPETVSAMASLAITYYRQGRLEEAEKLQLQVYETRVKIFGDGLEHPETVDAMVNLAITYYRQGRLEKAEKLQLQVYKTRVKISGLEHPKTVDSMARLAITYCNQGRLVEGEKLQLQVYETRVKILGLEHPETVDSMARLAITYCNQGRLVEGEKLQLQVYETRVKILGSERPETVDAMAKLALTYCNQGRLVEAEKLQLQVYETRVKILGLEHPETVSAMASLAWTYCNQGRLVEAEKLQLQVYETRVKILGLEHPETVSAMASLAWTYCNQGRLVEAEKLQLQVYETRVKISGLEHPETVSAMASLAITYCKQGRLVEAEKLQLQVYETRVKILGLEHPKTVDSMARLAIIYCNQGRLVEAEKLQLQVHETRVKISGLERPETVDSMYNLALTYRAQGRLEEAAELEMKVQALKSKQK